MNEEIHERLSGHAELDAHDIDVQVQDGEATLSGSVNDRRSKHFAEDVVVAVFGVRDVINHLKVRR